MTTVNAIERIKNKIDELVSFPMDKNKLPQLSYVQEMANRYRDILKTKFNRMVESGLFTEEEMQGFADYGEKLVHEKGGAAYNYLLQLKREQYDF